jgi:anti-sigma regulatory factor (Ser/Thr protein kinase)
MEVALRNNGRVELVERVQHEPREVSRVRHRLADALAGWGVHETDRDVAVLLTSEIVTNAIRYGEPPVHLQAVLRGAELRVCVGDAGQDDVRPAENVRWDDGGGRGLHLVEALAHRWGVDDSTAGKQVWFELLFAG